MDKQEMVDKNMSFIEKMVARCKKLIVFSIVPKFIGSMMTVKKLAKVFGYNSIVSFIKACYDDEDMLETRYDAMDPETQAYVDELYNNVFVPQTDDLLDDCNSAEKMLHDTDIAENIVNVLTEGDDADSEDDDDATDSVLEKIPEYLIEKLFDGIDITHGFDDEPDDDGDEWR